MNCGLTDEARPVFWKYLFGYLDPSLTTEENNNRKAKMADEYSILLKQTSLIPEQKQFWTIFMIISNDVQRTDSNYIMFSKKDSEAHKLLENVLRCWAVYNRDTGYVQGMGDFAATFMHVFFKEITADKIILFDNSEISNLEGQSMIFWIFVDCMHKSHHDEIFGEIFEQESHMAERVAHLISNVHMGIRHYLSYYKQKEMIWIYRFFLLQYRREYKDESFRLWDSFYSCSDPYIFIIFFTASIVINTFPFFVSVNANEIGEVMTAMDRGIEKIDPIKVLRVAEEIFDDFSQRKEQEPWLFLHRKIIKPPPFKSEMLKKLQSIDV